MVARTFHASREEVVRATKEISGGERLPMRAFKMSWSYLTHKLYAGLGAVVPSTVRFVGGHGFDPLI